MPNYKKMYLRLFRATEEAIGLLIEAQRECEEMAMAQPEAELILLAQENTGSAKAAGQAGRSVRRGRALLCGPIGRRGRSRRGKTHPGALCGMFHERRKKKQ